MAGDPRDDDPTGGAARGAPRPDRPGDLPADAARPPDAEYDVRPVEGLPQKTVLVVEDDEAVSSLLVALLEDRGYAAIPARDGRSAIELARAHRPDLITLDLALPGTDGHEVLQNLKTHPDTRDIPVVVISAFTQILPAGERKKLAYLLGKPFDVTEVLEIVQATVGNPYL